MHDKSAEQFATAVVKRLRDANYVAYFAGGCVRDKLLSVEPKDYDVATSARPEDVRELFGRRRTIAVGQSFGVITVLGPKPHQIEVATFRSDGAYTDGRRPDSVTYSSPEEDAFRRDFTINGMFYDPLESQLIDFVDGQRDLEARSIRAIGNAADRIEEDRLRMLRAVRFASTYEFQIEAETLRAVQERAGKITSVSQERITHELQRMLVHSNRAVGLALLRETRLLERVLPWLEATVTDETAWSGLLGIVGSIREVTFPQVLTALLGAPGADLQKKELASVGRQLKLSNNDRKSMEWIAKNLVTLRNANELPFSEVQPLLVCEWIGEALALLEAILREEQANTDALQFCHEQLRLPPETLDPEPFIGGQDLAGMGLSPGPAFAEHIKRVRIAQLNGQIHSKEEAIALVRQHM